MYRARFLLDTKGFIALISETQEQDLKLYEQDPTPFEDLYQGFDPAVLTNHYPIQSWKTGVNTDWQRNEIFRTAP